MTNNPQSPCKPESSEHRHHGIRLTQICLIAGIIFFIVTFFLVIPMVLSGAERTATIIIPKNATTENIADSLTKHIGKDYSNKVMRLIKIRNVDLSKRHGMYEIGAGDSPFTAMRKLLNGSQKQITVTVNGFRSMDYMASRIAKKMEFSKEDLLKVVSDPEEMAQYGLTPEQALALFLDDSHNFYWTTSPKDFVEKIGKNYNFVWNARRRNKAQEMGFTPAEVMILASIIDEESNRQDEKPTIASVYINRLRKGMRLQSDPTVRFALNDFTIKRVTGEHTKVESPYNTYRVSGLPPAPIRTTSVASIDAVLEAPETDYIYMCARPDFSGYHNFATTYEEHLKNAKEYQNELDRRNIH